MSPCEHGDFLLAGHIRRRQHLPTSSGGRGALHAEENINRITDPFWTLDFGLPPFEI